jgi:uncharacterized membrane protein YuzA (DUF378 family)
MNMIISILVIVGGINWGLVGLGSFLKVNLNLVNLLLGAWPMVENIVYLLVGICAVVLAVMCAQKKCPCCK